MSSSKSVSFGAKVRDGGAHFSIWSSIATAVELCLYDENGHEQIHKLSESSDHTWELFLAGIQPGQRYAYRIHGPWDPKKGHFCDPTKALIDPYAKELSGQLEQHPHLYPFHLKKGKYNTAAYVPKSIVIDDNFSWQGVPKPEIKWKDSFIYEVHVKGFSKLLADIPEEIKGTYKALWSAPALTHFKKLGVTALELLPIHQFAHDRYLVEKNLSNYWGYMSLAYFAPHNEYCSTPQTPGTSVYEFKEMVRELHKVGIEVILDVVYNHSCEGNEHGPILSLKGIDAGAYYHIDPKGKQLFVDHTGCGNTLNVPQPATKKLILESLTYWAEEMQVDGFRFDEAPALNRNKKGTVTLPGFASKIAKKLNHSKLIAEPWDNGKDGYHLGHYPAPWSEWNDRFRDDIRDYLCSPTASFKNMKNRLLGSLDLRKDKNRAHWASINMITCHDGFPLRDVFSYDEKHNIENGENNNDGWPFNHSSSFGHEGESYDTQLNLLRRRQVRNALALLYLSKGCPMLLAGDEMYKTQGGNNNAYCQDNHISWLPWSKQDDTLIDYCEDLMKIRKKLFGLNRETDFSFFQCDGSALSSTDPAQDSKVPFMAHLKRVDDHKAHQEFLLLLNPFEGVQEFLVPEKIGHYQWKKRIDTFHLLKISNPEEVQRADLSLEGFSLILLES
ncbi:MAG: glycogen debranching protein GlgX [Planctomycetes bacterium]|nr:glycogen debranching protein GlgX [Planctomycetota bacterium]